MAVWSHENLIRRWKKKANQGGNSRRVRAWKGHQNIVNTIRHGRGSAWRERGGRGGGVHTKNTHLPSLPFSLPLFCLYLLLLPRSLCPIVQRASTIASVSITHTHTGLLSIQWWIHDWHPHGHHQPWKSNKTWVVLDSELWRQWHIRAFLARIASAVQPSEVC